MNKQPEVTERTKKKLIEAFWELFKEKRIEKISIGAITKQAGYNRGTFYEYFTDIYDLLSQAEDELLNSLQTQIGQYVERGAARNLSDFTRCIVEVFSGCNDRFYLLISPDGDPTFHTKMREKLKHNLFRMMGNDIAMDTQEYLITYVIASVTGLFSHWYTSGKKKKLEELITLIQQLVCNGVFEYLGRSFEDEYPLILEKEWKQLRSEEEKAREK